MILKLLYPHCVLGIIYKYTKAAVFPLCAGYFLRCCKIFQRHTGPHLFRAERHGRGRGAKKNIFTNTKTIKHVGSAAKVKEKYLWEQQNNGRRGLPAGTFRKAFGWWHLDWIGFLTEGTGEVRRILKKRRVWTKAWRHQWSVLAANTQAGRGEAHAGTIMGSAAEVTISERHWQDMKHQERRIRRKERPPMLKM